jgi:alpha-beta hydrolase superfamily lysophospholipase
VNHVAAYFPDTKGRKLFYQYWEESSKAYDKAIILLHGIGYHSGSYPYLIPALMEVRYKVYAFDFPGFGKSPGKRGDEGEFIEFLDAIETFRRLIVKAEGAREILLLGHSLGAVAALAYLNRYAGHNYRTVAVSPLFSHVPETFELSAFSGEDTWKERLEKDPLFVTKISARLAGAIMAAADDVVKFPPKETKAAFFCGESDPLMPFEELLKTVEGMTMKAKTVKTFPRMQHDLFCGQRRDQVFDSIRLWYSETEYEYKAH